MSKNQYNQYLKKNQEYKHYISYVVLKKIEDQSVNREMINIK